MKNFLSFLCFAFIISIQSNLSAQSSTITWLSGDGISSPIRLRFELGEYQFKTIQTSRGPEIQVVSKGGTPILKAGAPDLPKFSRSVIIPDLASYQVDVVSSNSSEIENIQIAPSKGNLIRNIDPSSVAFNQGAIYQSNAWFPENNSDLRTPHILADFRGQTVVFYPFQYNPVSHKLKITNQIEVVLRTNPNASPENPYFRSTTSSIRKSNEGLYSKHFVNYSSSRYSPIAEQARLLIITDPSFQSALDPLVLWKRQSGMNVEVITLAEAGGDITGISNAIRSRYLSSEGLSYVILVGDISQIPSPTAYAGKSDPTYGFVLGNDTYPEVMVGRISAENIAHVQVQVDKIIQYEKSTLPTEHLSHFACIASDQGPGDDNEFDWEHERIIRNKLSGYTYDVANELYDGSQGELDPAGNPSASNVSALLNQGIGLINYTGHGSSTSFGTSGFSNTQINQLQNDGKLPFVWSVGCVNGEFDNGTCFGEAWLRATRNGQPTGAVAAFMSSINQSWDPPMAAQDEMVDLLTENIQTSDTRTFGGLSLNGCLKMNDEYGTAGDEMTGTWHIFGDPSMMVRTSIPLAMNVTHASSVAIGSNGLSVNVDAEGAKVAISQNGILLGTSLVQGGLAWVDYPSITTIDPLLVTVTAFNRVPYQGEVLILNPDNAYLILNAHQLTEISGNGNQLADFSETIQLNAAIVNVGGAAAAAVSSSLSCSDNFITLLSSTCEFGSLQAGDSVVSNGCFTFSIANFINDQTIAHFVMTFNDANGNTWSQPFNVLINAPVLNTLNVTINEVQGNGNGNPDSGELFEIQIQNSNSGHATSTNGVANLSGNPTSFSIAQPDFSMQPVSPSSESVATFTVSIDASVPAGSYLPLNYTWTAGQYSTNREIILYIGAVIEDAESGDYLNYAWQNEDVSPWTIDNSTVYQGTSSFRSGIIPHSGTSELKIDYSVSQSDTIRFFRKVSSEQGYDFLRFYIDGIEMQSWSGLVDWSEVKFPVAIGDHQFSWIYEKDDMIASNEDASWIDYIEFPAGAAISTNLEPIQVSDFKGSFSIFPNPSNNGDFTLHGKGLQYGTFKISMLDATGRLIEQKFLENNSEMNQWNWNLNCPNSGFYFLEIIQPNSHKETLRLIIR
jgi:hypothetical protein